MQIEDFIYDAAVLKMGVCLERFLKRQLNVAQSNNRRSMQGMIEAYYNCTGRDRKTRCWMRLIREKRNKVAHASDEEIRARLTFEQFQEIRQTGLNLDQRLRNAAGHDTGMSEIMISSSLPYDMGNAGDLLKHGALATFVDWFLECGEKGIRYADPFAGRPWGYILKEETRRRMEGFSSSLLVIENAQPHWRTNSHQPHWRKDRYYGSSHVVRNIANARGKGAEVFASDKDKLARSDLEASGIALIDKQYKGYKPKRGFDILDERYYGAFDLILLDPFADFLLNEFGGYRRETSTGHFESISEAVKHNHKLCVMLFVLHVEGQRFHDRYVEERKNLRDCSFSMRCPRIEHTEVDGEAGYDMEILLISKQFAERSNSVSELNSRLRELRRALEDILQAGRIEFQSPDWLDTRFTARGT